MIPFSLFDENLEVLRNLEAQGVDLGLPRSVDFEHVFPDQASAAGFASAAEQQGFAVSVRQVDRDGGTWDVRASIALMPTCQNITDTEQRLDVLARSHGGQADGWGFFSGRIPLNS